MPTNDNSMYSLIELFITIARTIVNILVSLANGDTGAIEDIFAGNKPIVKPQE